MSSMTHRQRLITALNHKEPDRVPLDFGTGGNTSPVPEVYTKMVNHYPELDGQTDLIPHMLRLAAVDEIILTDLDIDTRPISMKPIKHKPRKNLQPGYIADDWGVLWKEIDIGGAVYRELGESPLINAYQKDLRDYSWWPDPLDSDRYIDLANYAQQLYHDTDFGLVGCPAFNGRDLGKGDLSLWI